MHLLRLINLEVPESILSVPIKKYAARVSEQMTGQKFNMSVPMPISRGDVASTTKISLQGVACRCHQVKSKWCCEK